MGRLTVAGVVAQATCSAYAFSTGKIPAAAAAANQEQKHALRGKVVESRFNVGQEQQENRGWLVVAMTAFAAAAAGAAGVGCRGRRGSSSAPTFVGCSAPE